MKRWLPLAVFALGVVCAALAGFLSPARYVGFLPLAAGLVFVALYLIDDGEEVAPSGDPAPTHRRR